jgi:hypothetical protein
MNKTECKNLETKLPPEFFEIARRFSLPAAYLAKLACELFADDPPAEIRIISGGKLHSRYTLSPAK